MTQQELGILGERMAQRYLLQQGYRIHVTNYRYIKFEVDIIAEHNDKLIVVEVKTRETAEIGEPWQAVTRKKQRQIIATANHYVQARNLDKEVQFDIISIVHNRFRSDLEHIPDAFST